MKKTIILLFGLSFYLLASLSQGATLNLKLFIEGYYLGSGQMQSALFNCGISSDPTATDTILIELHDSVAPFAIIASAQCILKTNGNAVCSFSNSVIGHSYYIAIKQKSSIETWSANPVLMTATTNYDFSTAQTQAYEGNMVQASSNIWLFYSGDLNQDGNIDQIDFPPLDCGINQGLFGCYAMDLNGDGNVDLLDLAILSSAICTGIYSHHP